MAIEAGLEPLAQLLLKSPDLSPADQAHKFISPAKDIINTAQALDGAMAILIDQIANDVELLRQIQQYVWQYSQLEAKPARKKNPPISQQTADKYRNYFEHSEALSKVPSHRIMAMLRGRNDGVLQLNLNCDPHQQGNRCLSMVLKRFNIENKQQAADCWLTEVEQGSGRLPSWPLVVIFITCCYHIILAYLLSCRLPHQLLQ